MATNPSSSGPQSDGEHSAQTRTVALPGDDDPIADETLAKKIGRHVVLEQVGRGGMGTVFRAYDPKLQREVALKRLRPKALGIDGRARFEQEARAMAALSHPNVVAVYDVELLDDGQLVLVMEFVHGPTLRSWVRQDTRAWQEVLPPFLDAGRGLAAAHRAGLLHRDFKPANVLVTPEQSKVTDFGLAKRAKDFTPSVSSISDSSTGNPKAQLWDDVDEDDLTRAGEVMGTPRYMAPEQHQGRELSPAVDQFAFCVALWEALARAPPYSGEGLARKKLRGPPEWPASAGPRWLGDALRRGLQPEPDERWPSMGELLTALSRDPSKSRATALRGLAALAIVGVAGGIAYSAGAEGPSPCSGSELQFEEEWGEPTRVEVRDAMTSVDVVYAHPLWQRVDQRLDGYARAWIGQHRAACEATVRREHSAQLRDLRVGCLDRGRLAFRAVIDVLRHADVDVLRSVDTMIDELPDLARCGDLVALQEGTDPPAAQEAEAVADVYRQLELAKVDRIAARLDDAEAKLALVEQLLDAIRYLPAHGAYEFEQAELWRTRGKDARAAAGFRRALRIAVETRNWARTAEAGTEVIRTEGRAPHHPEQVLVLREIVEAAAKGDPVLEAEASIAVGLALTEAGEYEEGEQHIRDAIEQLLGDADAGKHRISDARNSLGVALLSSGNLIEAESEYRKSIELLTESLGSDHPRIAIVRGNLAAVLRQQGRLEEAESEARAADAARRRSLGARHVLYGSGKTTLADILTDARKFSEAEEVAKEGVAIVQAAVGRLHLKTADAVNSMGRIYIRQGKATEAEEAFRETLAIREELMGPQSPASGGVYINIAAALRRQDRLEEAEEMYQTARRILTDAHGPSHPDLAMVHNNLGVLYLDLERYEEAKGELQRALELDRTFMPSESLRHLNARSNLALALVGLGEHVEAEAERRAIIEALEGTVEPDDPELALNRVRLAEVLLHRGEAREAKALATMASESVRENGLDPVEQGDILMTLCRTTIAADPSPRGRAEARALAQRALQLYVRFGIAGESDAKAARQWLAEHPE